MTLEDYKYNIKLEFINLGEGKLTREENGLSELAIDTEFDHSLMKRVHSMRGSLSRENPKQIYLHSNDPR